MGQREFSTSLVTTKNSDLSKIFFSSKLKLKSFLLHFSVLLTTALTVSCGGGGGGGGGAKERVQGKLAQAYVVGARVWYDKNNSESSGNFLRDPGEPDTLSNAEGDYSLENLQGDGVLITQGGSYRNSQGQSVPAAPMLAPAPSLDQPANITPITTLVAAEPSLKEKLASFGDWNADIADPNGTSAPLLRIAKTVEGLSGLLSFGEEPITNSDTANLRAILIFAEKLASIPEDKLANESTLKEVSSNALAQILEDPSIVRTLGNNVKTGIRTAMFQVVSVITEEIPVSGRVVESEIVKKIEETQSNSQLAIQEEIDQQVIVSLGGFGFEFDPIITSIDLKLEENSLYLTAEVVDERPDTLSYRWSTSPPMVVRDPFSSSAVIENFDNNSLTVILQVTDDTDTNTTEVCAWDNKINPKICNFLSN